jgi:hypothetical protein
MAKGSKKEYISLGQAKEILNKKGNAYSVGYLRFLARTGKLKAIKFGTKWMTTEKWLDWFLKNNKNNEDKKYLILDIFYPRTENTLRNVSIIKSRLKSRPKRRLVIPQKKLKKELKKQAHCLFVPETETIDISQKKLEEIKAKSSNKAIASCQ